MPDVHAGYGFAIGNIAAFDMSDPDRRYQWTSHEGKKRIID